MGGSSSKAEDSKSGGGAEAHSDTQAHVPRRTQTEPASFSGAQPSFVPSPGPGSRQGPGSQRLPGSPRLALQQAVQHQKRYVALLRDRLQTEIDTQRVQWLSARGDSALAEQSLTDEQVRFLDSLSSMDPVHAMQELDRMEVDQGLATAFHELHQADNIAMAMSEIHSAVVSMDRLQLETWLEHLNALGLNPDPGSIQDQAWSCAKQVLAAMQETERSSLEAHREERQFFQMVSAALDDRDATRLQLIIEEGERSGIDCSGARFQLEELRSEEGQVFGVEDAPFPTSGGDASAGPAHAHCSASTSHARQREQDERLRRERLAAEEEQRRQAQQREQAEAEAARRRAAAAKERQHEEALRRQRQEAERMERERAAQRAKAKANSERSRRSQPSQGQSALPPRTKGPMDRAAALEILDFPRGSDPSAAELRACYRKKAMEWHPDRQHNHGRSELATEVFQRCKAAFDYLSKTAT